VDLYVKSQLGDFIACTGGPAAASAPFAGLTLYLPCDIDRKHIKGPQFVHAGCSNWQSNPGPTINTLHRQFSSKLARKPTASVADLITAEQLGAKLHFDAKHPGFHQRNTRVAESCYVLAFTWGDSNKPKDGGTADTWKKASTRTRSANMRHIPLGTLKPTVVPTEDAKR
jgi:hypothetical protein